MCIILNFYYKCFQITFIFKMKHNLPSRNTSLNFDNFDNLADDTPPESNSFTSSKSSSSSSSTSTSTFNQLPEYSFIPNGYSFVRPKKGGESRGFILQDENHQYLVKLDSIVTEYIGLSLFKEIASIVGRNLIVPDFHLERDSASNKFGLFVKMIPNLVVNTEVSSVSVLAAPSKKRPKNPTASYHDLVSLMVISMLIGDNDCNPENSGSLGDNGVRIDLGNAFYWVYSRDNDFRQKLFDYFRAFYGEPFPIKRYLNEFESLEHLLALRAPANMA